MSEAFAEAKKALEESTKEPVAKAPPPPASETPPASTPDVRDPATQSVLDKALNLIREGREAEVDPRVLGQLRRFESQAVEKAIAKHSADQKEEAEAKALYLQLERNRIADGDEFNTALLAQPEIGIFHKAYKRTHPEVTIETPDAVRQRSEQEVANELTALYGKGFERALDAIAPEVGLSDAALAKLKSEFAFDKHPDSQNLSLFLAKMITTAVTEGSKGVKAKADASESEAEALRKEVQALRIARKDTPAALPGSLTPGSARGSTATNVRDRWAEALADAKEAIAAR